MMLTPAKIRQRFVRAATRKFERNVADFARLRKMVRAQGGRLRNDHGAIRCADPVVCELFVRAANVLGLRRELDYRFPDKKLVSFDLQAIGEDPAQFKIFVSQVDLAAYPAEVAALIREDCRESAAAVDHTPLIALIEKAECKGMLSERDAERLVGYLVGQLMTRNGPPIRRDTLETVARISGEAASALALGPDFNHLTIDVQAAGFRDIENMARAMLRQGFRMLSAIQGARGGPLRQTATLAATMDTPVREADGRIGVMQTERQFVEIIERGQARNAQDGRLWRQNGEPLIFRNFLAANADKIFDAALTRIV